jgi:glyoxylase-like metal-dependent hydrolase (beta-lactamase superfamily II)
VFLEKADFGEAREELKGIFLIEGTGQCSNVYLLDGAHAMIDAANVRGITNEVDEEFDISRLEHLFITHPHSDHVGGLIELLRFCNPNLYVHQAAIPYVRFGKVSLAQSLRHYKREHLLKPVKGGEKVTIGGGRVLEIIDTPGHAPGHICLFDHRSKSLFSGDLVITGDAEHAYLAAPDPFYGEINDCVDSVARLFHYPARHLFPGHGCPSVDDAGEHLKNTFFHYIKQVEKNEQIAWIRTGAALADAGRPEEAIILYDIVLEALPNQLEANFCKGMALLEMSRFQEALDHFGKSLSVDPEMEMALIGKGFALVALGRKEEALAIPAFRDKAYGIKS